MKPVPVSPDGALGRRAGRDARLDRVVLSGQTERVVAHRVQHSPSDAAVEVRDRVPERVVLQMPDVRFAAGIGQHLEHIALLQLAPVSRADMVVRHLPGALALPDALPFRLDYGRVVTVLGH